MSLPQVSHAGQGPSGMTSVSGSISTTAATVTFTLPSQTVTIVNGSSSTTMYFNFNGTATNSNAAILPLSAYVYDGVPVVSVSIIGSASSGTYSVIAH